MRRESVKRENMKRLYAKDNYENLIWIRSMVDNPNTLFITNFIRHITDDIMPVNKYKLKLDTHEIENLGQDIMDGEEESLSFIDFIQHPVDDVSDTGIKDYIIINLQLLYAGGFYIWIDINNQIKIFGIDDNGTVTFDDSILDKQTMNMFIDADRLFKFTVCKR